MRKWMISTLLLVLLILSCVSLAGCDRQNTIAETIVETTAIPVMEVTIEATEETCVETDLDRSDIISVSVYPYLPDVELFCELLVDMWAEIEPDIQLELRTWDAYGDSNPQGFDVLMYDALFTTYLVENNYVQAIELGDIEELEGIIPSALDGAYYEDQCYGIPNLMCSFFLIHWADDADIAQVNSFEELYEILSLRKENNTSDKEDGLITNFATDYPFFYLDTLTDLTGKPDVSGEILNFDEPEPEAMEEIYRIQDMQADIEDVLDPELGQYGGAVLFSEGYGSAIYGYSESMAYINNVVDRLAIRTISHCDGEDVPLFFADVVSLSSRVQDPIKRENCIKLMNLMTSEEFITKLSLGTGEAQYLLPARHAVYDTVEQVFPMYGRLYELVSDERNHIMRYDAGVYDYLANAFSNLILEY